MSRCRTPGSGFAFAGSESTFVSRRYPRLKAEQPDPPIDPERPRKPTRYPTRRDQPRFETPRAPGSTGWSSSRGYDTVRSISAPRPAHPVSSRSPSGPARHRARVTAGAPARQISRPLFRASYVHFKCTYCFLSTACLARAQPSLMIHRNQGFSSSSQFWTRINCLALVSWSAASSLIIAAVRSPQRLGAAASRTLHEPSHFRERLTHTKTLTLSVHAAPRQLTAEPIPEHDRVLGRPPTIA